MAKEFVRKIRNVKDASKLNLNESLPADLVQDKDYKMWYHGKNRHVKLANDEEVVHVFGNEEIKGEKTFDDLLTAKKGITDEGDLDVLGETKLSKGLTVGGDESIAGNLTIGGGTVTDGLEVKGDATFQKGLVVTGDLEAKGNETIEKDLTVLGHAKVKDIEVTGAITQPYIAKTLDAENGYSFRFERIGQLVTVSFLGQTTAELKAATTFTSKIPDGFKPIETKSIDFLATGRHLDTYHYFNPDATIVYQGETIPASTYIRGVRSYFTKDAFPQA